MPDSGIASDPTLWQGAELPTETVQDSRTVVDINQTQQRAILNWETFNVGLNTTVNFNQASADWTVLNRVNDPAAAPSKILGEINAIGGVYIINRNGIIFGGGSQVNVHALVASDMDVGLLGSSRMDRDDFFLNTGIGNTSNTTTSFSTTFDVTGNQISANVYEGGQVGGGVKVEKGAEITTDIVSPDASGFIYLFGANVENYGTLTSPGGEVALVAAQAVTLTTGAYSAATIPDNVLTNGAESFRGTGFKIRQYASTYTIRNNVPTADTGYRAGTGSVVNDGLVETPRGITVMNGDTISIGTQGVISADTSITRNSMVLLDAVTRVSMDGTISIQPYENGETLPLLSGGSTEDDGASTVQKFTPAFVEMSAQLQVVIGSTGLVSAPSATVSLNAKDNNSQAFTLSGSIASSLTGPQRILLASGATIDVAGLQNVELPVSYNYISFKPYGTEFADMPLQRDGVLVGETLWIDIRETGTRSDGTSWVGTPLADASGYVSSVGRSIKQLMTTGGTVSMTTSTSNAGTYGRDVVLQEGSVINTAGGSISYVGGLVPTTRLVGADGRIYSMANADPTLTYVGLAGTFTTDHSAWGITESGSGVIMVYEAGYTEGYDAGGVEITTVNPVLNGTLLFGSVAGERQIAAGLAPSNTGGVVATQSSRDEMPSQGYFKLTTPSTVVIGRNGPAALPTGFTVNTILSRQLASLPAGTNFSVSSSSYQTTLSADTLSSWGLSGLIITANNLVVESGTAVSLAGGGTFSAKVGGAIDIAGTISAHSGKISLTTDRYNVGEQLFSALFTAPTTASGHDDIFVEGTLDVSGLWVNDTGKTGREATGSAYIDGGSIVIVTSKSNAAGSGIDATGSILLAAGSVLDASSGGYISPSGKAKTNSSGVMAGSGGAISLLLYQGSDWNPNGSPSIQTPVFGTQATLQLNGTLLGYGFEDNATLTLAAPKIIQIGGQPGTSGVGLYLSEAFFNSGGFGSYVIQSAPDGWSSATTGITVAAGAEIVLTQKNLSSTANYQSVATGTSIASVAKVETQAQDLRAPVDLSLQANNILIDAGATITTDPLATITLVGSPTLNTATGLNTKETRAENVLIRGRIIDHGGTLLVHSKKVWLGSEALIDLSGTYIANSRFGLTSDVLVSGTVVAGGSFTIEGAAVLATSGNPAEGAIVSDKYVVAESGAVVDVSGYSGTVSVIDATSRGRNQRATTTEAWWSDAGTVSINTAAFLWAGTFEAGATDPRANGGTLILGGSAVTLQQDGSDVAAALANITSPTTASGLSLLIAGSQYPFSALAPYSGKIVAAADQFATFDNVFLYSGYSSGGAARIFTSLAANTYGLRAPTLSDLTIKGSLDWTVTNRLHLAAKSITSDTAGSTVSLEAPYVLLTGGGGTATNTKDSTLTVMADAIDIESATFSGFKSVALVSHGDLRLSTPKVANGVVDIVTGLPNDTSTFTGSLVSAGDILLDARRTYVATAVDFTIKTPGEVTFEASAGGRNVVPLSAGGSITVEAKTIEQNGYVFAPQGAIALYASDEVTLGSDSLTSVSLAGTVVPYGETLDGSNWFYNTDFYPLTTPPSKSLVLYASNVTEESGAVIDLSGGGDLQAMEFVAGTGGSRDVLASSTTGETVYALLPSTNDSVSAFDVHFTTARSETGTYDDYPLAGTQVYIDGGNGIPAGTYTLYPAHYATLPGALRVVYYGDNAGRNVASGTTLRDGTVLVTGHYTQSTLSQTRSAGEALFAIQTYAVWSQYSEYTLSGANNYYVEAAQHDGVVVPRLPIDAGRLAVIAQQKVVLDGIALTQPAAGGRGSELDITASKVAVVSHQQYLQGGVPDGYLGLDVSQLNGWGFESVLVGGLRTDTSGGTLITPVATSVLVDTEGEALTAPEILLVAQAAAEKRTISENFNVAGQSFPVSFDYYAAVEGSGTVMIASGSVINTTGEVHAGYGRNYYFAPPTATGQTMAADIVNGTATYSYADRLGGTLDGNVITGADFLTFLALRNLFGTGAAHLQNYSYPSSGDAGLGALFVASNDTTLAVSGPTGKAASSLTIRFADVYNYYPVSPATVTLAGSDVGRVAIEAGTTITTKAMTAQATALTDAIVIDPSASLTVKQVNLTASTVSVGSSPSANDALVLSQANLNQLASVQSLSLKAMGGAITFRNDAGDLTFDPGSAMEQLTLDARTITGVGGNATVRIGGTVTLVNTGSAAETSATAVGGTLAFEAAGIELGGGTQTIAGFSQVNWTASEQVSIEKSGTLTLGTGTEIVDLAVTAPNILVGGATATGTEGQFALVTAGDVTIERPAGAQAVPEASAEIGGIFAITAANITHSGTIQVQAGTLTLRATTGDVTLGEAATSPPAATRRRWSMSTPMWRAARWCCWRMPAMLRQRPPAPSTWPSRRMAWAMAARSR
ncbi:MAG: filamentous hemagglutinin N-terminal domain-containing protein [Methylacidiphilales bacterium]|nr:filamentous hemagglutinin N-terminal domain-containing protein [Candidatus Methylacidiphilales bacterium]